MRRGAASFVVITSLGVAHADPWEVTGEAGVELDSNVERIVTRPESPDAASSPVSRLGAELERENATLAGGTYALRLSALGRFVDSSELDRENVVSLRGGLSWVRAIRPRVAIGFTADARDDLPISDEVGARTIRALGGRALLRFHGTRGAVTLAAGARRFDYKPDSFEGIDGSDPDIDNHYDWWGPTANLKLDLLLWQNPNETRSLTLTTAAGVELRHHRGVALADAGEMNGLAVAGNTSLPRRDRNQHAQVFLSWESLGDVPFSVRLSYQLEVLDSNSVGWSTTRHVGSLSTTIPVRGFMITPRATLQLAHYPDGRNVMLDPDQITRLDDDNLSSLQLVIERQVSTAWWIEARGATWRDFATTDSGTFRRSLVSFGVKFNSK